MKTMFPPFLQAPEPDGGTCEGAAVLIWQGVLLGLGKPTLGATVKQLIVDGKYGRVTASLTKSLQVQLMVEADGNLGPKTREALKTCGIDINGIPFSEMGDTFWLNPETGEWGFWDGGDD